MRRSNAVSAMMLITAGAPGAAMSGVGPLTVAVRVLLHPRPARIIQTNQSPGGTCALACPRSSTRTAAGAYGLPSGLSRNPRARRRSPSSASRLSIISMTPSPVSA